MFKEGERIKYIDCCFSELKQDNYYTVLYTTNDGYYISLLEQKNSPFNQYHHSYFISLHEERKIKIKNIKEKIYHIKNQLCF